MVKENIIVTKSEAFSIRINKLHKYLTNDKKEYRMSDQVKRSGTSIGANIAEALQGQSKKDFINKLSISLKEACETEYWLKTLHQAEFINKAEFDSIIPDCKELIKLLTAIIKTSKKNESIK